MVGSRQQKTRHVAGSLATSPVWWPGEGFAPSPIVESGAYFVAAGNPQPFTTQKHAGRYSSYPRQADKAFLSADGHGARLICQSTLTPIEEDHVSGYLGQLGALLLCVSAFHADAFVWSPVTVPAPPSRPTHLGCLSCPAIATAVRCGLARCSPAPAKGHFLVAHALGLR